jgi:hypothetical protein
LLPVALIATMSISPWFRATCLGWRRWGASLVVLVVAPLLLVGPFMARKGGLATKPAIAHVLGGAPRSAPDAVERARPLDPDQSTATTYALAVREVAQAVGEVVSMPLIPLTILGFWTLRPSGERARTWLFAVLVAAGAGLALVRLHATCGYCAPRHTMLLALMLLPAAAAGLEWLLARRRFLRAPALVLVLGLYAAWCLPSVIRPLNHECAGYRMAGAWLADRSHAPDGAKVLDGPGWALFYGEKSGYTFGNMLATFDDPQARFVVVREAHLLGPWGYCELFRKLARGRLPVARFPEQPDRNQSRVYIFDRDQPELPQAAVADREPWSIRSR